MENIILRLPLNTEFLFQRGNVNQQLACSVQWTLIIYYQMLIINSHLTKFADGLVPLFIIPLYYVRIWVMSFQVLSGWMSAKTDITSVHKHWSYDIKVSRQV